MGGCSVRCEQLPIRQCLCNCWRRTITVNRSAGIGSPKISDLEIDGRLRPLLEVDDEQYNLRLSHIIKEHAEPLIDKILGSKLNVYHKDYLGNSESSDLEDLRSEAILRLIKCLKIMRIEPVDYGIKDLPNFVSKITFNVYNHYLRKKYPLRHGLKKKLSYLLASRVQFDLWLENKDKVAGFSSWKNIVLPPAESKVLAEFAANRQVFISNKLEGQSPSQLSLDLLLTRLFEWAGHPIEIDLLVNIIADLLEIKDHSNVDWSDQKESVGFVAKKAMHSEADQSDKTRRIELREYLILLWREIKELPVRQRKALLMSLRDENGDGLINSFSPCGIASPLEIAEVLEMDIGKLAEIWNSFPLKDAVIAEALGVTNQQVINLRKSARERLARRMLTITTNQMSKIQKNTDENS